MNPVEHCTHKRVTHQHGTRTAYVLDGCRCDDCRAASTAGMQTYRRLKAYGRYDKLTDAEPVRAHVRALMDQGMGWKRIAKAAGVAPSSVGPVLYGCYLDQPDHPDHHQPRKQISRVNAEKLLAVTLDLAPGQLVDATGTRRRVQALVAMGWSLAELSRRLGIDRSNFFLHAKATTTDGSAAAVRALYDELWDQPGGSTRALNHAKRNRWVPPLAWDDETIDNPDATPHTERTQGSHGTHPDDVEHFMGWADNLEQLAGMLGISRSGLDVMIKRHDIEVPIRLRVGQADLRQHRLEHRKAVA